MVVFFLIIIGLPLSGLLYWRVGDARLRKLPRAKVWRAALGVFCLLHFVGFAALFVTRWQGGSIPLPAAVLRPMLVSVYVYHLVILPLTAGATLLGLIVAGVWRLARRAARKTAEPAPVGDAAAPAVLTRRQVLAGAMAAAPPLLTAAAVPVAVARLSDFEVKSLVVPIANLPRELEGLSIAHVSDTHVGHFTSGPKLRRIVEATNNLDADLVLMTGDLIDFQLRDLPAALEMAHGFRSRHGTFTCEGNHDLIESRRGFEDGVRKSGLPLLLNESATVRVRGQAVQVLGLAWGGDPNRRRDALVSDHMRRVVSQVRPDAFAILLAHHPHAFDKAAEGGIPLTLAGHTHGGQLMLSRNIGPGPMMYKYWSGLYRKPGAALVVSNGVGNWFPLRINAPAQILRLTLRREGA